MKTGTLVRLPEKSPFGPYATVVSAVPEGCRVTDGRMDLDYEPKQLHEIGYLSYLKTITSPTGNRTATFGIHGKGRLFHVLTRDGQEGIEETRRREMRRELVLELNKTLQETGRRK